MCTAQDFELLVNLKTVKALGARAQAGRNHMFNPNAAYISAYMPSFETAAGHGKALGVSRQAAW
jgi:hypothetical protein